MVNLIGRRHARGHRLAHAGPPRRQADARRPARRPGGNTARRGADRAMTTSPVDHGTMTRRRLLASSVASHFLRNIQPLRSSSPPERPSSAKLLASPDPRKMSRLRHVAIAAGVIVGAFTGASASSGAAPGARASTPSAAAAPIRMTSGSGHRFKLMPRRARRDDGADRSITWCAVLTEGAEEVAGDCGDRRLRATASFSIFYDCERRDAIAFGRISSAVSSVRVRNTGAATRRLGRAGRSRLFEGVLFGIALDPRRLPDELVFARKGSRTVRIPIPRLCVTGAPRRSILPGFGVE